MTVVIGPRKLAANSGARAGDAIILIKPIGTGIISTAIKYGKAEKEPAARSVEVMVTSGKEAARAMSELDIKGATDVTGFGMLGHTWEMAKASNVTIEIDSSLVPLLSGAIQLAAAGVLTGGDATNREYVGNNIFIQPHARKEKISLFYGRVVEPKPFSIVVT